MSKVLLVDDDPIILKIYGDGLSSHGLEVESAPDGLQAIKMLRSSKPDLVVLDLMMPKFSGVDVLRFIRAQKDLDRIPVVILSNAYMGDLARQAVALGVQKALLKVRCTPSAMAGTIKDVLAGKTMLEDPAQWPAVPTEEPPPAPVALPPLPPPPQAPPPKPVPEPPVPARSLESDTSLVVRARRRHDFLEHAWATRAELRKLLAALVEAATDSQREMRLQNYYRKVQFVTVAAGLAGLPQLAQMSSAFEALLFDLMSKPALLSPSMKQTITAVTDFLDVLLQWDSTPSQPETMAHILVVDDDRISNRLVTAALQNAHLQTRSTEYPALALEWLAQSHFDLILLDVELGEMNGFDLCKRLRALPEYLATPVIYITSHHDFEHRAQGILSGGDDLIAKPIVPLELVVKVVMHLVRRQMALAPRDERAEHTLKSNHLGS
jgi:DNA-binding response OmpR family regulator